MHLSDFQKDLVSKPIQVLEQAGPNKVVSIYITDAFVFLVDLDGLDME